MAGLIAIRLQGPDSLLAWVLIVLGLASLVPFVSYEARHAGADHRRPAVRQPLQWPVQLTAFLFGMSVLGAQIPLSTFARTDPDVAGYGLGADASFVSTLIGVYVVFLAVGAFTPAADHPAARPARRPDHVVAAGRARLRAVAAVPRQHDPGAGQHGGRRRRLRRPGRRPARERRRGCATRAHRLRHRHDQRDQDHRRRHRVVDLRDRPGVDRLARGPDRGPRAAVGLPHRLGGLRRRGPARRGRPAADAEGRHVTPSSRPRGEPV